MRRLGSEREEEIEVLRRRKRRKEVWSLVGAFGGFGSSIIASWEYHRFGRGTPSFVGSLFRLYIARYRADFDLTCGDPVC